MEMLQNLFHGKFIASLILSEVLRPTIFINVLRVENYFLLSLSTLLNN